MYVTGHCEVL